MNTIEQHRPEAGILPLCEALNIPRASFYRQQNPKENPIFFKRVCVIVKKVHLNNFEELQAIGERNLERLYSWHLLEYLYLFPE